jgi:DNA-binding CsgD family transcriptional regulator
MIRNLLFFTALLFSWACYSQYSFEGKIAENVEGETVYLSIIEDYRKLSRPYLEQIIKKTSIDSLGFFNFKGDNLSLDNRIYRIHIDGCSEEPHNTNHFFGRCEYSKSILFIANNRDTISFPTSFADEVLCKITSTNPKSSSILEIDVLKEEMALDFYDYPSEANRKLNAKKWFTQFQEYGQQLNEPLAELYVFDFLSDKRNETYGYYLKDLASNSYYTDLADRLEGKYVDATFTKLYRSEIATDKQITTPKESENQSSTLIWALIAGISVLINIYFLVRQKSSKKNLRNSALDKLTAQEQKIVAEILKDKTNKEIAADLFISLSTVKTHINNLNKKLNVSSREEIKQLFT